jgi:hypothetical protein
VPIPPAEERALRDAAKIHGLPMAAAAREAIGRYVADTVAVVAQNDQRPAGKGLGADGDTQNTTPDTIPERSIDAVPG